MLVISEFHNCPACNEDSRLMDSIVTEEIAKGNMSSDMVGYISEEIFCNADPKKPPLVGGRIPGARVYRDICTKCGNVFITRIEIGHVVLPTKSGAAPQFI